MTEPRRRLRAVLYDFDGTLADTADLIFRSFQHTLESYLGFRPTREQWLAGFGPPIAVQLTPYARSPEELRAMRTTYAQYQDAHTDAFVRPFPGTVETVAELAARGYRLAIVTSKLRAPTLRGMGVCGLLEHFDEVVTPDVVTNPKPHPEGVLLALDRLGVAAEEAIYVGDSPHDVAAGRAAGVLTVAAPWGPYPRGSLEEEHPDFLIEEPRDVLALVESLDPGYLRPSGRLEPGR